MRRALNASPIEFLRYFTAFGAIVAVSLLSGCAVNDRAEADWQWKQSNPNYSSPVPQDQRREWAILSDGDYGNDRPGGRPR